MNILIDPLPRTVNVGGREWPINTAFQVGIEFELMIQSPALSAREMTTRALGLYYPQIPENLNAAVDALMWFYRCGGDAPRAGDAPGVSRKAYDFDQDAGAIYSAFMSAYGIDLRRAQMHWWQFRELFWGLPPECEFVKIMGYRTADLKGMGKTQKKHYEKMRKLYAIKNPRAAESNMSLAERDQQMKDYISRRFREAGESH